MTKRTYRISTRYLGPDDKGRGARYRAAAAQRTLTLPADHGLTPAGNRERVAAALAERLHLGPITPAGQDSRGDDLFTYTLDA